jgi:hypothetical protein
MRMTYLLEMNDDQPRQYRITVLEDTPTAIMAHGLDKVANDGFKMIGFYDTVENLMSVLDPYIHMETSR